MEIPTVKTLATYYNTPAPSEGLKKIVKNVLLDGVCPDDSYGRMDFEERIRSSNPIQFEGHNEIYSRVDGYLIGFYKSTKMTNSVGVHLTPVLEIGGKIYKLEEIKI